MVSVPQLKRAIFDPAAARDEVINRYNDWLNSKYGINYLKQDWDTLILLDGCRYDLFEEWSTLKGKLKPIHSNASTSQDFFRKNFQGGEFGDLVYYSANPHIDKYDFSLYDLHRLWESDFDEKTGTVLPSDAVDRVLKTEHKYRNKRIVVHLMQPHRPFLGDKADEFEQSSFSARGVNISSNEDPRVPFWWERMESGELDRDQVWQLYRETLQVALPEVERLVENIPGKTVISADHGNAFGEDGVFGHPGRTNHEVLTKVPWLEVSNTPRKEVIKENADVRTECEHYTNAKDQLEALGYVE